MVVAVDGTLAHIVDPALRAWHAVEHNAEWLGIEFVQPRPGDKISDEQYRTAAWWLTRMSQTFGFALNAETLVEHQDMPQGKRDKKSDIGPPFSLVQLQSYV